MKNFFKPTLALASLLALVSCSSGAVTPKTLAAVATGSGVSVDVIATNSWGSGFNGAIRITNTSFGSTITSCEVKFTLNSGATAGTAYEGSLTNASGTYTYTCPSYTSMANGSAAKDWGFGGTGSLTSSTITSLKVNGQTITLGGSTGGGTTPDTTKPTVSLASSATSVTAAGSITLTATASDNVGVSKVEFYDGTTLLGTDTSSPFTQAVTFTQTSTAQNGTKSYTAKAYDAANNSATSSTASVSLNIPAGTTTTTDTTKPTVSLASSGSSVTAAGSITLTATASDNVGVSKVDFYDGATLLGTDTSSPFTQSVSFTQTSTAQTGTKSYTAKATDAAGNNTTSSAVSVALNIPATSTGGGGGTSTGLYVDPTSSPAQWANSNSGDSKASVIKNNLASQPMARWITSSGAVGQISSYLNDAASAGKTGQLVIYNIPGRDCGNYSSGGAGSPEAYKTFIDQSASAVGSRAAIIILEPDALPLVSNCSSNSTSVTSLISYAVDKFKSSSPNAKVYIDIGHSAWLSVSAAASLLNASGISRAAGFALNTSNYQTTSSSTSFGNSLSSSTGGAHFVIDTSRNGNGPGSDWCNPAGRHTGNKPQAVNSGALDYYLWIKIPGESDGNCGVGSGSSAGQFLPQVAYDLAK